MYRTYTAVPARRAPCPLVARDGRSRNVILIPIHSDNVVALLCSRQHTKSMFSSMLVSASRSPSEKDLCLTAAHSSCVVKNPFVILMYRLVHCGLSRVFSSPAGCSRRCAEVFEMKSECSNNQLIPVQLDNGVAILGRCPRLSSFGPSALVRFQRLK
jgi:hypothetical protein